MSKAAIFASLFVLAMSDTNASALGIGDCEAYEREHEQYVASGIRADMLRGPEWAKANLPANRVQQVLRFLFLEEQIRFRCQDLFAEAELIEMERRAEAAAREKALANIPPPPIPRPEFARIPNTKRFVLVPPLPTQKSQDQVETP